MDIRNYCVEDEEAVIHLWNTCGLVVPWNDPALDIRRKMDDSPDLFFIGEIESEIVASCMAGYDGHRGWIYYLSVKPSLQKRGLARRMMEHTETALRGIGCPKIDLMVRRTNVEVIEFYNRIGYREDPVVVLSRRLIEDSTK